VCVYARTHTHCTDGVLNCEPRSRDETPGDPEESRLTEAQYTCRERGKFITRQPLIGEKDDYDTENSWIM